MTLTLTLAQLTERTRIDVLDHLDREVAIPVLDGLQAQGDLIVVPAHRVPEVVPTDGAWREVPREGIELLRGGAGGNTHVLVAEASSCHWTTTVDDPVGLAIGMLRATRPVYLIHAEHGGSGIAPGTYVIRRQRQAGWRQNGWRGVELVAD